MINRKKAFSVIEFLVAITIFITLAGIIILRFESGEKMGKDSQRVKDLGEIANALETYYTKNSTYPDDLDDLVPTFLGTASQDPKNEDPYVYSYCKDDGKYALMARLEENNQALQGDYDKDWPDTGTACDCNPSSTEAEDPEDTAPYTYCIKNP